LLQGKSALWSHLFAFHVSDQRNKANLQQSANGGHQTSGKDDSTSILGRFPRLPGSAGYPWFYSFIYSGRKPMVISGTVF